MNPYGQQWQQGGAAPSIRGALPSASLPNALQAGSATYTFTDYKNTILNSTIKGPQQYRVYTQTAPPLTFVEDNMKVTVAKVEWQSPPILEIRGVAARQEVRNWLHLSSSRELRVMTIRDTQYVWVPRDGCVYLCQVDTSMHVNELAKYYKTLDGTTTLVMTPAAMQRGLLEPAIVGIVILSSGQNID